MSDKLVTLITGANQGIGFYAAGLLAKEGKYQVLLGCRDVTKGEKAIEQLVATEGAPRDLLEVLEIDVTQDESIDKAVETVKQKYGKLDILVSNAGVATFQGTLREQYQFTFAVNVFGVAVTTESFLPLLKQSTTAGGKKIVFVSSAMGSLGYSADNDYDYSVKKIGATAVYRSSKSALNMVLVGHARELENNGFVVAGVCPGYCGTTLNGFQGPKHPRDGAKVIQYAIEKPKDFVHAHVTNDDIQYPW